MMTWYFQVSEVGKLVYASVVGKDFWDTYGCIDDQFIGLELKGMMPAGFSEEVESTFIAPKGMTVADVRKALTKAGFVEKEITPEGVITDEAEKGTMKKEKLELKAGSLQEQMLEVVQEILGAIPVEGGGKVAGISFVDETTKVEKVYEFKDKEKEKEAAKTPAAIWKKVKGEKNAPE